MESHQTIIAILSASIGAFVAWILIRCVTYFIIRRRLINYIITVINIHLKQVHDNNEWLKKFTEHVIKEGSKVDGAPYYTKEEFQNLTKISIEQLFYLTKKEQVYITELIANMLEFETLMQGFCLSAQEFQKNKTLLSKAEALFMKRRSDRIQSLVKDFPTGIKRITELPDIYNKINADELIVQLDTLQN